MKYCSNCGTQFINDAKFCSNCGSPNDIIPNLQSNIVHEVGKSENYKTLNNYLVIILEWEDNESFEVEIKGTYCGDLKNNIPEGYGEFITNSNEKYGKVVYKGEWVAGMQHGKGFFENKDWIYEGNFSKRFQCGEGVKKYNNGRIDRGIFKNGSLFDGFSQGNSSESCYFTGEIKNGKWYRGRYIQYDEYYEGIFNEWGNLIDGYQKEKYYQGEIRNGERVKK